MYICKNICTNICIYAHVWANNAAIVRHTLFGELMRERGSLYRVGPTLSHAIISYLNVVVFLPLLFKHTMNEKEILLLLGD